MLWEGRRERIEGQEGVRHGFRGRNLALATIRESMLVAWRAYGIQAVRIGLRRKARSEVSHATDGGILNERRRYAPMHINRRTNSGEQVRGSRQLLWQTGQILEKLNCSGSTL